MHHRRHSQHRKRLDIDQAEPGVAHPVRLGADAPEGECGAARIRTHRQALIRPSIGEGRVPTSRSSVSRFHRWRSFSSGKTIRNFLAPAATSAFEEGREIVLTIAAAFTSKTASLWASFWVSNRNRPPPPTVTSLIGASSLISSGAAAPLPVFGNKACVGDGDARGPDRLAGTKRHAVEVEHAAQLEPWITGSGRAVCLRRGGSRRIARPGCDCFAATRTGVTVSLARCRLLATTFDPCLTSTSASIAWRGQRTNPERFLLDGDLDLLAEVDRRRVVGEDLRPTAQSRDLAADLSPLPGLHAGRRAAVEESKVAQLVLLAANGDVVVLHVDSEQESLRRDVAHAEIDVEIRDDGRPKGSLADRLSDIGARLAVIALDGHGDREARGQLGAGRRRLHLDGPCRRASARLVGDRRQIEDQAGRGQELGQASHGNDRPGRGLRRRGHGNANHPARGVEHRPTRIPRADPRFEPDPVQAALDPGQRADATGQHGDVRVRPASDGQHATEGISEDDNLRQFPEVGVSAEFQGRETGAAIGLNERQIRVNVAAQHLRPRDALRRQADIRHETKHTFGPRRRSPRRQRW